MKKRITFEETVKFQHEIEIEVKNSAADDAVEEILNKGFDCLDTACYVIGRVDGVKIIEVQEDDGGQDSEMECIDVCEIPELEEVK